MTSQPGPRLNAAYYADSIEAFLRASDDEVYAPLASPHGYTLAPEQLSAWRLQLPVLRAAVIQLPARFAGGPAPWIHLEFDIPRLGRRVDAVLVLPECVIPIEFKVGAKKFERLDIEQAWDFRIGKIGTGAISGKNRSRPNFSRTRTASSTCRKSARLLPARLGLFGELGDRTARRLQSFIRLTDIALQIATCVLEQFGAGCVEFVEDLIPGHRSVLRAIQPALR